METRGTSQPDDASPKLIFHETFDGDPLLLSQEIRHADLMEAVAMGHHDAFSAISLSVKKSVVSYSVRLPDGGFVGIFGLRLLPETPSFAVPWFISTPLIEKIPVLSLKAAREVIEHWSETANLFNFVHEKNFRSKRFIRHLGFEIDDVPVSISEAGFGERFHLFWMGERPCASHYLQ